VRIDVHNHALPEAAVELLRREPAFGVRIQDRVLSSRDHPDFVLERSFTDPAAKLAELERVGIEGAAVSVSPTAFHYDVDPGAAEELARTVNDGLQRLAGHAPERLRWLAHLPLQAPERAVAVLRDAAAAGAAGVEVGTSVAGRRLDEPQLDPVWAAAATLGLPVMLHPAYNEPHAGLAPFYLQNVIGNLLETTIAVERLICAGVLDRHPGLALLLVHGGGYVPYQAGRLRHAATVRPEMPAAIDPWAYLDHLWFDTITHDREALRFLVARVGAERVLLGTDLPFDMAPPDPMVELEDALDATTVRRVAEENPGRLLRMDG
jgi:aminocarboxymuconate-semialdehyde decarboxylase